MVEENAAKVMKCVVVERQWDEFRRDTEIASRGIAKLSPKLDEIMKNAEHIPNVSDNLREAADTMRLIKEDLIEFATGKRQVSLLSHLMTVLILGAIALVILVERSTKSIDITATGIHIGNDPAVKVNQ